MPMELPSQILSIIRDRAQAYGVDPGLLARIVNVESGGNPYARAKTSSAAGPMQFTSGTWKDWGRGGDVMDPYANIDAGARFTANNLQKLVGAGFEPSPQNVYLSHFLGSGGAREVLGADPSTPLASMPSMAAAIKANPFLKDMTVANLTGWASNKMGGGAAATAAAGSGGGGVPVAAATPALSPTDVGLLNQKPDESGNNWTRLAQLIDQSNQQQQLQPAPLRLNFPVPPGLQAARLAAMRGMG